MTHVEFLEILFYKKLQAERDGSAQTTDTNADPGSVPIGERRMTNDECAQYLNQLYKPKPKG